MKMNRHPKTMNAFFRMMEKFDAALYSWAQQQEGVEVEVKLSNSATASKSVYISATNDDWDNCIEIRISDHSPKYSGADKNLYWGDYKNPTEVLNKIKQIILEN